MTVSSGINKVVGSGNGLTTVWPFSFKVFAATDLTVIYTDAVGADTTLAPSAYVVALNADQRASPGGTVTYSPAIATGTKLTILRVLDYTQETDLENQGGYYPEVVERGMDRMAMQIQQLNEQYARTLKVSPAQSAIGELEATDAARANTFLGFDASGLLTVITGLASAAVSLAMAPVVGAANLLAARAAMGVPGLADNNAFSGENTFSQPVTVANAVDADHALAKGQAAIVPRVQAFTGSGTYTPHASMVYCVIEAIGAGGGGGGAATGGAGNGGGGGGGGSGSYSRKVALRADIGASQTVTIGAAGTAGTAGNNAGGNGGDTSVGALCIGKGGTGGAGWDGAAPSAGGAGGVAGTGDVAAVGNPGGRSEAVGASQGRGISGYGANAPAPGGGGAEGKSTATTQAGGAAAGKGGGGSGGASFNGGGTAAGGAGGAGFVVITEFCSA